MHMSKKKIIILIIIAVAVISIGLYTVLPLFTNTLVDEPLPTAAEMSLSAFDITAFFHQYNRISSSY